MSTAIEEPTIYANAAPETAEIFFHPTFLFGASNQAALNQQAYERGRDCASSDHRYGFDHDMTRWSFYAVSHVHRRLAFELGYQDRWFELHMSVAQHAMPYKIDNGDVVA